MTKTVFINDALGLRQYDRPTQTPNGNPIPTDSDTLLHAYGWRTETETIPDPEPSPEEKKQKRIAELKSWIALGYAYWVTQYIREQYDLDAELAIQRQRETKAEDFQTYFTYCEDCKTKAQENLAAWQKELEELEPTDEQAEA